jgi:RHS repeat-associated protein
VEKNTRSQFERCVAGRKHDPTGLTYNRQRYMSPAAGSWIASDAAEFGVNWYRYVNANPANLIDPFGEASTLVLFGDIGPLVDKEHGKHRVSYFEPKSFWGALSRAVKPHVGYTDSKPNDVILAHINSTSDAAREIAFHAGKDVNELMYLGHISACGDDKTQECAMPRRGVYINAKELADLMRQFRGGGIKILGCDAADDFGPRLKRHLPDGPSIYAPEDKVTLDFEHNFKTMLNITLNVPPLKRLD